MEDVNKNNISQSIFWIEVDKIKPNPYQPRKDFGEVQLRELADSIRQYGVLQPLVATRKEIFAEDGGMTVEYELIAGERRLRASKLAGVATVPVVVRTGEQSDLLKLELAIIENLQREDLNPVDRARAFQQLAVQFKFKHGDIAIKVGRSREYVSNTIRLLSLPAEIIDAILAKKITEGHCRPLMMLSDRKEEQMTLFKEIMYKKLSVREAESISRKIAVDKVRKKEYLARDPEMTEMENKLTEKLGTRVSIESKDFGGRLSIDFFSKDDVRNIMDLISVALAAKGGAKPVLSAPVAAAIWKGGEMPVPGSAAYVGVENRPKDAYSPIVEPKVAAVLPQTDATPDVPAYGMPPTPPEEAGPIDDIPAAAPEKDYDNPDLYSLKDFSI